MIKGSKICGISDINTLNFIINHLYPPQFIGFICNYKKSSRYVEFEKLNNLLKLNKKKSNIRYYDPSGEKHEFKKLKNVKYYNDLSSACLNSDLIVLHTEWNDFKLLNFKKIVKKNKFKIFDLRNIYSPTKMKKLKIDYFGIGR